MENVLVKDIEKNYRLYKKYLKAYIKRDGIDGFIKWLDTTDAIKAPASTKYHLCEPGGLIQHSLNVFNRLIRLISEEYGDDCPYSKETIAFVSLLHDVSKINFYDVYLKNVKNDKGQWEQVPTYNVREEDNRLIFGIHEENSVYMLNQFFKLSYEEALAIRWHGGCGTSNDPSSQGKMMEAYKASTLALLLHIADMQATCIDELTVNNTNYDKVEEIKKAKETDNKQVTNDSTNKSDDVPFTYTQDDDDSFTSSYATDHTKYIEDSNDEQDFETAIDEANDCPF
jgi:hypothetical protein